MIAPVREPASRSSPSGHGLASARRAVAAVLFRRTPCQTSSASRVSSFVAWTFVGWTIAVAASYFAFGAWWAIHYD
jgi:hypothetical protein